MNPTLKNPCPLTAMHRLRMRRHALEWRRFKAERQPELALDHLQCAMLWNQLAEQQAAVSQIATEVLQEAAA